MFIKMDKMKEFMAKSNKSPNFPTKKRKTILLNAVENAFTKRHYLYIISVILLV